MNTNFSPFLQQMHHCRQTMRKLRKKIYKTCRNTRHPVKKLKENTEEIMDIFVDRKIPDFVAEALKKRRNFDIKSIKNISINTILPLQDIQNRTYSQQKEVENLFTEHKKRLQELKKKQEQKRILGQAIYQMSSDNVYSSTNEDEYLRPIQAVLEMSHNQSQQAVDAFYFNISQPKQQPQSHNDYFDFNINESSMHQGLGFLNF